MSKFINDFNRLHPVEDPVTPVGFLDRLSLLFGVHEESAVIVLEFGKTKEHILK